jgi:type I restriction enzyme S subunit
MFRELPRYASTRRTTLPWAVEIPSHWQVARAKSIMRALDVRSADGEEELLTVSSSRGVVPRASAQVNMFKAESYAGHKLCWPGDLVINSLWAWGRGLGVARHHGIVSTAYGVYRQHGKALNADYLHQLVRSEPFHWELQVRSQGVWKSRLQITDDRWLDAPLLVPAHEEQAAIVKYLAHANARIEKAISAKKRLLVLLEEQKLAIIREEIDRSGGARLPLKRVMESTTAGVWGLSPEDSKDLPRWCVRVADFDYGLGRVSEWPKTMRSITDKDFRRKKLRPGDLLLEASGGGDKTPVGRVVIFDRQGDAVCSNFLQRLRPATGVISEYLALILRDMHATGAVRLHIKQTTGIQNLDLDSYFTSPVPIPEMRIQREVLSRVQARSSESDRASAQAFREIALLEEFRTRVVADVVTGQVDVRAIAASLAGTPEQDTDLDSLLDDDLEAVLGEGEE